MSKRRDWDKVGEIVSKIKELGLSYKEGAERFGISVRVLYEYSRRQKKQSVEGVTSRANGGTHKSSRPLSSLPAELKDLIAEYRRSNSEHGFKKIQDHLKSKHLVVVTRKQIREVLKEHSLLEKCNICVYYRDTCSLPDSDC